MTEGKRGNEKGKSGSDEGEGQQGEGGREIATPAARNDNREQFAKTR